VQTLLYCLPAEPTEPKWLYDWIQVISGVSITDDVMVQPLPFDIGIITLQNINFSENAYRVG
jgi:hypothetical protein